MEFVALSFDPHFQESRAVNDLRLGISRLLQMEKNLVLSRYDDYSVETLRKIIDFIVSEVSAFYRCDVSLVIANIGSLKFSCESVTYRFPG